MKATLLLFMAVVVGAHSAYASDRIEFYADESALSCNIVDSTPRLVRVHMFHTGSLPARSVNFSAFTPACWAGATWLGDVLVPEFTKLNSTHSLGIIVQFGGCIEPPGYLGYMNFAAYGQALSCCEYAPAPYTGTATMRATNCDGFTFRTATGRGVIINGNATCSCDSPVPVAETTWGKIKSMYR